MLVDVVTTENALYCKQHSRYYQELTNIFISIHHLPPMAGTDHLNFLGNNNNNNDKHIIQYSRPSIIIITVLSIRKSHGQNEISLYFFSASFFYLFF